MKMFIISFLIHLINKNNLIFIAMVNDTYLPSVLEFQNNTGIPKTGNWSTLFKCPASQMFVL